VEVLQVNKLYYPWIGGVEKVVQDIAEGLKDKVAMSVLVCQSRGRGSCDCINGVSVHRAASIGMCLSMPVSLSFPLLLRKLSKDKDILHFHAPFPLGVMSYLLIRPKGKLIVWWHSDIVRQKNILRLYRPFLLQFLKKADKIIVATAQHIENSAFLKAFKNKCEIIPFGVDIKQFQVSSNIQQEVAKIRKNHGDKIVLFVGRLIYYKGVEYLIRAMKYVDGKLLIIGQGSLENKLRAVAAELQLGSKIVFLGKVEEKKMVVYYHSCDVFVLPSVAHSEAFGIVQLEAMACGKPVINTDLQTGVPWVSRDGETGITVSPADSTALAKAINRLFEDSDLREKYGRNALIRVEKYFGVTRMLEDIYKVYEKVLG